MSEVEKKYIGGHGPMGARIMLLGECPTYKEVQNNKGFSDTRELDTVLKEAGIRMDNCWKTYVSKYHVGPNTGKKKIPFPTRAKNEGIDIEQQLEELQSEINQIKPNVILGIGKSALWALTGKYKIEDYRGSLMWGMGTKFVPTFNPAHLGWQAADVEFKGYWNRQLMIFDAKRALKQSTFPELNLPHRTLEICRNSHQLAQFRDRYKHKKRMAVDIEASGTCIPVCVGLSFDRTHGITIPLWNIEDISTIPTDDLIQMWIILAEMLWEKDIVGQNFNYDRDKIKRLGFVIRRLVSDTMLKAHAINPELPKGLGFNTSIYTEEPFYKNEGMYHGSMSDLLLGCARDACVTLEVDENMDADIDELSMRPFYEQFLMRLPGLYWSIENQGFRVNHTERDALLRKYVEWDERVRYELFKLVGTEVNVNSHKQIGLLLWENFKLPQRQTTGEEDLTALLNNQNGAKNPVHRKVIELILEGRRVRKSISTYLMALPDYDGRMRTTCFPCLDTGRTSTGQQDPPIRPSVEVIDENGKKKDKNLGIAFQTMTKHGDVGADIRGMYVPDDCHIEVINNLPVIVTEEEEFVQADSAQAEARVIFLLAKDEEALHDIDHRDYHAWTASWFFGGEEADYSKKTLGYEHPIRFVGKTLRHAGHLGAGKRRAATTVNTDARKFKIPVMISEADADRALKIFHARQPKIQQVFQAEVIACLKRNRNLVASVPYGIDVLKGGQRTFFERFGEELFRQGFSYIPQRAVSDNTKAAGLRIRERIPRIKIVMESHDALLFSIPISKKMEWIPIIKQEMERPIDFSNCSLPRHPLSIPCEIEVGKNYRDLSKFKDIPIIAAPTVRPKMVPVSITEAFLAGDIVPPDTRMDDLIYHHQVEKKLYDR